MQKDDFTELQQALGLTHHPHSILLDRALDGIVDPVANYLHDYMHGLFVGGVCNITVFLLLEIFLVNGVPDVYQLLHDFLLLWAWPGRLYTHKLHDIFLPGNKDKHRKAKHIKCQASDMPSLFPVLAMFVQTVLLKFNLCNEACLAFLALADIVDFLWASAKGTLDPAQLDAAVEKFLLMFANAFGVEWMTPKFHWMLHFGDHYRRLAMLLNCFVLERRHRTAKRYATDLKNISKDANSSLMMDVTSHHIATLKSPSVFHYEPGLIDGSTPSKSVSSLIAGMLELSGDEDVKVAQHSRFNAFGICKKGDVVLIKDGTSFIAGKILLNLAVQGVPISMVDAWALHPCPGAQPAGFAKWSRHTPACKILIETEDVLDVVIHTKSGHRLVTTLLPPEFR